MRLYEIDELQDKLMSSGVLTTWELAVIESKALQSETDYFSVLYNMLLTVLYNKTGFVDLNELQQAEHDLSRLGGIRDKAQALTDKGDEILKKVLKNQTISKKLKDEYKQLNYLINNIY